MAHGSNEQPLRLESVLGEKTLFQGHSGADEILMGMMELTQKYCGGAIVKLL